MKSQYQKLIFCFLLTSFLCSLRSEAQIIYTDVNPDDTIHDADYSSATNAHYYLDLNNDGTTDFDLIQAYSIYVLNSGTLCAYTKRIWSCNAIPKNISSIASDSIGGLALSPSSAINGGLTWKDSTSSYYNKLANFSSTSVRHCPPPSSPGYSDSSGHWLNQNDKYLGLKIIKNGLTYYGWIRLQIVSASSIIVKDYAYNSIPNQPILAGQTTCALPTVNVTASGTTTFCYGSPVTLTADSASGYTFQWQKNAVAISAATTRSYKVTTSGSYSVVTTNACGTATSTPLSCTRILNPTSVISTSDPLTYCAGQAINTMFTANTFAGVTYQWQKNSVDISGAIAQNYTAAATGKYRVRETANGCSRTSSNKSIIINCRIQDDVTAPSILSIYPSPASNSITIQFPSEEEGTIQIVNLFGQIVFSEKVVTDEMKIDVSRFQEGMYVARWNSNKYPQSKIFSITK